ncbi:hypothetical protein SAMN05518672_103708 [Chitinophaga sp. CF118]|uniref:hypothetical protein n=1 Tax=Chitinophaga sp. CF118 TaxID=1884367 RepID=UPI0008EB45FC|nr:hypothetical protein [Chitinophaga sp. CF118]SFD88790.1 hypothetical protein SAMN05518672_103708 [Chitinophaga sp. CF118]
MKKSTYEIWQPYKKAGIIISFSALLMLLFSPWIEGIIYNLILRISFGNTLIDIIHSMGMTLNKILLFLLNWGIAPIIFGQTKNEDERIERIKNYVSKHTLRTMVILACLMGLIMKDSPNLLIFTLIMQGYYLLLFRLCLYRDSQIVYLNEEQLAVYGKKNFKTFTIWTTIISALAGGTIPYMAIHHPSQLSLAVVVLIGLSIFLGTVQLHWKK